MKGVGSDMAARAIAAACAKQFPAKKPVESGRPAADAAPTTPVFPAKCYRTKPVSNSTGGFDPDCASLPDPAK